MTPTLSPPPKLINIDLASPAHKANPFPLYERLRQENPICPIRLPDKRAAWLVTRYDDAVSVLKDERFVKNPRVALTPAQAKQQPWMPSIIKPLLSNMLDSDRPNHTRLRALVQKAFTPQRIEEMRGHIERLSEELLARITTCDIDLIHSYALPLPATVIAEMLGVPTSDQAKFHRWSSTFVSLASTKWQMLKGLPSVWTFMRYLRKLIQNKRTHPQDDLVSALVQAQEAGDKLNEDELVAMIFLLLVAGHETTVNLIANGMLALLQHPDQLQRLRENPSLIEPAVEELLRYASPLDTATERFARENLTVGGVDLPRGSQVFCAISSANRDEEQFDRANELDIARNPNRHLSFGMGIHFCLGAPLARMEGQIAIRGLLQRFKHFELAVPPEKLRWRYGMVLRGMHALPLRVS